MWAADGHLGMIPGWLPKYVFDPARMGCHKIKHGQALQDRDHDCRRGVRFEFDP